MSDENKLSLVPAVKEELEVVSVPPEVDEMQKALAELNSYHKAALSASYPGNHSEGGAKLIKHLFNEYQQVLKQFNEHPYVIKVREEQDRLAKAKR